MIKISATTIGLSIATIVLLSGCGTLRPPSTNAKEISLVDQPLSSIDEVVSSMMTTSNGEVALNLGHIGKDKNYCGFKPVDGGLTMRFPSSYDSRWSRRQGKYVERLKEVAAALSLPLEEIPSTDSDGSLQDVAYVFRITGEPAEVSSLIKKLITGTFPVTETDRYKMQYQNMPASWVIRPGDEPTLV